MTEAEQNSSETVASSGDAPPTRKFGRGWMKPVLFIVLTVGIIFLIQKSGLNDYLTPEFLGGLVDRSGRLAPFVFIAIYTIVPVLMGPGMVVGMVGAAAFGPFWGFVYTLIGANLGAVAAFSVGRALGRDFVAKRTKKAGDVNSGLMAKLNRLMERNGLAAVLFLRLLMAPYNIFNYVASLTSVSRRDYAIGTAIGMIPMLVVWVFLGETLGHFFEDGDFSVLLSPPAIGAGAIFLLSVGGSLIFRKRLFGSPTESEA